MRIVDNMPNTEPNQHYTYPQEFYTVKMTSVTIIIDIYDENYSLFTFRSSEHLRL